VGLALDSVGPDEVADSVELGCSELVLSDVDGASVEEACVEEGLSDEDALVEIGSAVVVCALPSAGDEVALACVDERRTVTVVTSPSVS
jgi:hypothetical protein